MRSVRYIVPAYNAALYAQIPSRCLWPTRKKKKKFLFPPSAAAYTRNPFSRKKVFLSPLLSYLRGNRRPFLPSFPPLGKLVYSWSEFRDQFCGLGGRHRPGGLWWCWRRRWSISHLMNSPAAAVRTEKRIFALVGLRGIQQC